MKYIFLGLFFSAMTASAQNCTEALLPVILQDGNSLTTKTEFDTYQWVKDGQPIAGATSRTFAPTEAADYQVKVTKRSKMFAFTPTGIDGYNAKMPFQLFPNPTSGSLTIVCEEAMTGKRNIEVMNFNGQKVLNSEVNGSETQFTIDVSQLPKGVYGIRIQNGQRTATRTLIVE